MTTRLIIPQAIATRERLRDLLVELELSGAGASRRGLSADLIQTLALNNMSKLTKVGAHDLRATLADMLADPRSIKVVTAQPLTPDAQSAIADWCRSKVSPTLLLSFRVDPQLLGGAIIQTPRKQYDFSLQSGLGHGRDYLRKVVAA